MKPIVQQLPFRPNRSFIAGAYNLSQFETSLHQHPAYELILFTSGNGNGYIGKYVGTFEPGDVYLLGADLPHCFQPVNNITAIVIHFKADCLGSHFFNLPECQHFMNLLDQAKHGLKITVNSQDKLQLLMQSFETATDGDRIILLLQCLQTLAVKNKYFTLSKESNKTLNATNNDCIDRIIKYTTSAFKEQVTLSKVAAIACKSIPSFCHYFKTCTQKTYFNYLNEVRIAYACSQLLQTDKPVVDIGYESGYNTVAHFHRQFLRFKKTTPLQYRKLFSTTAAKTIMKMSTPLYDCNKLTLTIAG
ncbi:hypothetical protein A3860_36595 [Niastella vici]|uniref:HTH araC/xylS-type domain-containing protein n=1 Tax=Niastella vici TaxID=1703345 RepID=A0A1V9FN36_9BACT|nr:AraC family transcriptional regulator [Niastella vici]OQP59691.1 hypothetical protein A3860_36595 [Niastella vici]